MFPFHISGKFRGIPVHNEKLAPILWSDKKAFQLKANGPLANRGMWTTFWTSVKRSGWGFPSEQVRTGPQWAHGDPPPQKVDRLTDTRVNVYCSRRYSRNSKKEGGKRWRLSKIYCTKSVSTLPHLCHCSFGKTQQLFNPDRVGVCFKNLLHVMSYIRSLLA